MSRIVLATLNATYQHCAFGLRYLQANLGELRDSSRLMEFTIAQSPSDVAEAILAESPRIVGLGVYIWNARQSRELVAILKKVRPDLRVVVGGPEVSYESAGQVICELADLTVQGEGEGVFAQVCRDYLLHGRWPAEKSVRGELPDVAQLCLPYGLYTDEDIRHRVIYVEASRGCPYKCEFCLSALDTSVRGFPLQPFLDEMDLLIGRGARQFKFVDRTFNLKLDVCTRILEFFLKRMHHGLFLHFEMVPDRLPDGLRDWIRRFPPGSLQFEIGIQTWNPVVAANVSRRQDYAKVTQNFAFLKNETGAHLHADLIAGLPGESWESFARGFDAVAALEPHEIQLGILKRLRGAPIARHDHAMAYLEEPPYTVLRSDALGFEELQLIGRIAKFWDLYANSGNFPATMRILKELAGSRRPPSLFDELTQMTRFLDSRHPQRHGIALLNQVESAWLYLTKERDVDEDRVRAALIDDYCVRVKRDIPRFLRGEGVPARPVRAGHTTPSVLPGRQLRHWSHSAGSERSPT